ncbi:MAG: GTP 3',8-cyclase MoaA [Bacteroidales bacterium]|nr:GTP 3',8-cyclase MoaA [Bacteroidales bacterium]MCF8405901.1 GTP 3',8-cyclase MoaA [Bacteroidales bacterium]
MYDKFNRKITYLRVSVTDRCNLRCTYCMPECGVDLMSHKDILSFEEILEVIHFAVKNGVQKIRITGGEPLVRRGIVDLVRMISDIKGIRDFGLTTNGTLLDQFAKPLADAGLHRVNISLDSLDPVRYRSITRIGDITSVIHGIDAAIEADLQPIKINCVIKSSPMEEDAQAVAKFCHEKGLEVRFIKEMDLEAGHFSQVIGGDGGNCKMCNRLRLTADGKLKPCLFSDLEFDVRELGIEQAFSRAIGLKPKSGTENKINKFSNIGG